VELTRKRQGKNIYELFGEICPHCSGLGHLVRLPGDHSPLSLPNYNAPVVAKSFEKPILDEKPILFDDYGAAEDIPDLVLLHHPSYQELGATTTRRRRRRRLEISSRDENVITTSKELELTNTSKPERKERNFLSRSSRRDESKLEKVMVEMRPQELDIYALMGVSPLIRLDKEFKDLKSVIVHIKKIGDPESETKLEPISEGENDLPSQSQSESEPELKAETSDRPQDDLLEESENSRPLIRRRRRRSSALQT
jgi:ribonuclease E